VDALGNLPGQGGQQVTRGDAADLLQAHIDTGKFRQRAKDRRDPVAAADKRDVIRDAAPERPERVGGAPGDPVTAAEDRVRAPG
jgi:hypothetical protein